MPAASSANVYDDEPPSEMATRSGISPARRSTWAVIGTSGISTDGRGLVWMIWLMVGGPAFLWI